MNKQQKNILIADDDVGLRETLCAMLEGAGYKIGEAATGAEALEKVVARKFHVRRVSRNRPLIRPLSNV